MLKSGLVGTGAVLSLALLMAPACKSTGKSAAKDELSDNIEATLPKGMVQKTINQDDIAKYVVPGDGSNGVPHTMDGIWWTKAHTVHFLASFQNAYWNKETHTASLLFVGPGTYSNRAEDGTPKGYLAPADKGDLEGYDIIYSEDGKMAWLCTAATDDDGTRQAVPQNETPYTMEWKADNHWTRHSKGQPDYELMRIVNADGTPDPENFPLYHDDFKNGTVVFLPSLLLSQDHPTLAINIDSDVPTYVAVRFAGFYTVTADGGVPVTMLASDQKSSFKQTVGVALNSVQTFGDGNNPSTVIVITPKKGARGTLNLTASPTPSIPTLSSSGSNKVTVPANGTAATVLMPTDQPASGRNATIYRVQTDGSFASTVTIHHGGGTLTETKALSPSDSFFVQVYSGISSYFDISSKTGGGDLNMQLTTVPVVYQDATINANGGPISDRLASPFTVNCYKVNGKSGRGDRLHGILTPSATPSPITFIFNRLGNVGLDSHKAKLDGELYGDPCVQYRGGLNAPAPLDYKLEVMTDQ